MIGTKKNICQSCGNSIGLIIDFGTSRDGSINTDYCFQCYQEGTFVEKNISLEHKIAQNIALAAKLGIARAKAIKELNVVLPNLKRWRKSRRKEEKDRMDNNMSYEKK